MSWFSRLWRKRGAEQQTPAGPPGPAAPQSAPIAGPAPQDTDPPGDGFLDPVSGLPTTVQDATALQQRPDLNHSPPIPLRQELSIHIEGLTRDSQALTPTERDHLLGLIHRLSQDASPREALDALYRLTTLYAEDRFLRLALAEQLYDLKDFTRAIPLLETLIDAPEVQQQAHFLLGDFYDQELNREAALAHYEAVLALDLQAPRARRRADRLRQQLDLPVASGFPTLIGAEEIGTGARFILKRELGRGGGGTVYLALDRILQRPVAVKVLHPQVIERPEARTYLFCEARIAAALSHPHIVAIYDLDEQLNLVVMEFCAGGALADQLATAPLPWQQALERLADIFGVLETVHRCGVVHRDLKPANLLYRRPASAQPNPLLLTDFGVAHAAFIDLADGPNHAGSLVYMAPEQRRGLPGAPTADLYACGVILLEMLLGHPPITQQQALQGMPIIECGEIWQELQAATSPSLKPGALDLAQWLLQPDPQRRPQDAAAAGAMLRQVIEHQRKLRHHQQLMAALEQRAGPLPHSPEIDRWLQRQRRLPGD